VQLGYSTIALALFGLGVALSARRKPGRFAAALWGSLAVGGVLFALGPFLIANGHPVMVGGFFVPLPPGLLAALTPGINIERVPSRHMVSVTLALAVLAGTGLAWGLGRLGGSRRAVAYGLVAAAVLFELWPVPLPLEDYRPDPAYAALTEPGTVLNVPFAAQDGHVGMGIYRNAVLTMGEQAMHGHPVVGGYVSRMPASSLQSVMAEPVLEYFAGCRAEAPSPDEVRSLLDRFSVKYVVVRRDWPRVGSGPRGCGSPPDDAAVAKLLGQSISMPIARSESSVVYAAR
jgi:hypothetical protein